MTVEADRLHLSSASTCTPTCTSTCTSTFCRWMPILSWHFVTLALKDKALRAQTVKARHYDAMSECHTKKLQRNFIRCPDISSGRICICWQMLRIMLGIVMPVRFNKASTSRMQKNCSQVAGGSEHIILDLILKLPNIDRGHDNILVFVDRPSKLVICYSHS